MNLAQRIVCSVALAAALAVVAVTVNGVLRADATADWFMYQPGSSVATPNRAGPSDGDTVRAGLVWMVAVGVWTTVSWRLFRTRR